MTDHTHNALAALLSAKIELDRASQTDSYALVLAIEVREIIAKVEKVYNFTEAKILAVMGIEKLP